MSLPCKTRTARLWEKSASCHASARSVRAVRADDLPRGDDSGTSARNTRDHSCCANRSSSALRDEVKAADESDGQAQAAFRNRLGVNPNVVTTQDLLLNARLQLAAAQFDRTVFDLLIPARPASSSTPSPRRRPDRHAELSRGKRTR